MPYPEGYMDAVDANYGGSLRGILGDIAVAVEEVAYHPTTQDLRAALTEILELTAQVARSMDLTLEDLMVRYNMTYEQFDLLEGEYTAWNHGEGQWVTPLNLATVEAIEAILHRQFAGRNFTHPDYPGKYLYCCGVGPSGVHIFAVQGTPRPAEVTNLSYATGYVGARYHGSPGGKWTCLARFYMTPEIAAQFTEVFA